MEKGYIGKIGNTGTQHVKAPLSTNTKTGKQIVKKGSDLRSGK